MFNHKMLLQTDDGFDQAINKMTKSQGLSCSEGNSSRRQKEAERENREPFLVLQHIQLSSAGEAQGGDKATGGDVKFAHQERREK